MYLSRVEVDVKNRQKIRDLTHVGAYHSWVEDSFPEEVAQKKRSRKLWRLDALENKQYLLIVSAEKPNLLKLEKYGVAGTAETKNYDSFLENIHVNGIYRFRAVLNPVHSVSDSEGKRGRVYPEVTVSQQLAFLERKAAANGFELVPDQYRITERKFVELKKAGQRPLHLCQVAYEGVLRVKDESKFRDALCTGIGRKKAYGFGMLTVIPIV
ncbi:MAG: type I-E CRISPR-associated protein Cas6/Cse3/CasE [Lachnospiraceae bacterium]|jgi:CRISPR system Cascade subunit CasE|nr:type I-E CRISPR-associated protein Cas6/Cse3/CasE [Lachnospiraceae bacterium]MCH4029933.1 type I-E CRISPR-associated protein Cas6/Cse3/CasE [Lachnospiraceae bacterium]MCH4070406.1 type I-E CRISPR-associated protein Cas6/Cse3/CasE [Lachnospiraceae bacterium]MCI1331633.1 type I-E CRISPR-associated protein Cas6/Cse3/CasE [Lachnospiraceae bacterium]MCI1401520.1 type I-E CRISPR-associated protein Cas6/Cse3/CasE [Lachnospiraceae bacterium]